MSVLSGANIDFYFIEIAFWQFFLRILPSSEPLLSTINSTA
jgi:hypothetical protein